MQVVMFDPVMDVASRSINPSSSDHLAGRGATNHNLSQLRQAVVIGGAKPPSWDTPYCGACHSDYARRASPDLWGSLSSSEGPRLLVRA